MEFPIGCYAAYKSSCRSFHQLETLFGFHFSRTLLPTPFTRTVVFNCHILCAESQQLQQQQQRLRRQQLPRRQLTTMKQARWLRLMQHQLPHHPEVTSLGTSKA